MADKHPMQADGGGAKRADGVENTKPGSSGESAGGSYDRPEAEEGVGRGGGPQGGQSEQDYHGPGKLGTDKVGDNQGD